MLFRRSLVALALLLPAHAHADTIVRFDHVDVGEDGTFCGGETVPLCHAVVDGILDISMSDNFGGDIRDGAWVDLDSSRGRTWRWRRQQPVTQRP
jgi:hypothetical protein